MTTPRLLLVHAHPDDETLTTGGVMARYAAQGVRVTLVTCTLGEEGQIIPKRLRGLAADRADQLGGFRAAELDGACRALGVTDYRFLGSVGRWRDSGMVWRRPGQAGPSPDAGPDAFSNADRQEQVEALVAVLREVRPQVVVTYADDGGYGHPDHIRAHEITMAATGCVPETQRVFHVVPSRDAIHSGLAALATTSGIPFPVPDVDELPNVTDESITTVIDVRAYLPAKIEALRAHGTQVSVWLDQWCDGAGIAAYALSNGVAQPITNREHFVLAAGETEGCADDLFAGLHLEAPTTIGQ
ncbi:N-acetyl-1-D-myo-inositol-2-amino-2-deoxy-alpha-D-glucopyranoside deacetylase [Frankia gtarii]|uniref:N-acetyl-1-D-myo-inositol-2-amino-2-deoxy-alpha- D-glucopyranoside deacetylase n=1 Tax=Frankia gtarii TaxID=2950102 RepID=UPI0021C24D07|nr:N-acetyl-1-D-myo-inositol-2-amino-2-deoxy-alpha-D-glucopyranoside deacetylase [Frankia gtarii]